jgi:uncharacterized Zn finger protein (UPF0148 family)
MIKISKTKKTILKKRCGYCPRVIFRDDEPDGEFRTLDGKIICPTCRVLKTSKLKKQIKADKKKYEAERKIQEEASSKKAKESVMDIAMASQDKIGKKYKLKK